VTIAFTFAAITVYLMRRQRFYWIALIPGGWYTFIPMTAILASPKIGFNQIPGVNSHAL
jgi:carbon starvation protein CstA